MHIKHLNFKLNISIAIEFNPKDRNDTKFLRYDESAFIKTIKKNNEFTSHKGLYCKSKEWFNGGCRQGCFITRKL